MPIEHIVVDGSNIATEGRSLPSLKQLEEAVTELRRDHPSAEITVIVDATFAHRIDLSELPRFEQAVLRGEYVHPPAGAIGRGDAFLLRIAEKVDGTVLSNDSFQEFHGEHPWLFERGRLLGATPVPGIGWIFSPRQPVRGPRSHQAVRETTQAKKRVTKAIAVATKEVVKPAAKTDGTAPSGDRSTKRRARVAGDSGKAADGTADGGKPTPLAVNDPLAFISFIAEHRLGEELEAEVESYTSHGAVVRVGEMRCYVPLANLGNPPPRSAREVLKRSERRTFVLTALDPQRRGAELALPGIASVSGHPREETVAAEVILAKTPRKRASSGGSPRARLGAPPVPTAATPPPGRRSGRAPTVTPVLEQAPAAEAEPSAAAAAEKAPAKRALTKQAGAKRAPAKQAPVHKAQPAAKKAPAVHKAQLAAKKAPSSAKSPSGAQSPKKVQSPKRAQSLKKAAATKAADTKAATALTPAQSRKAATAQTQAQTRKAVPSTRISRPSAAAASGSVSEGKVAPAAKAGRAPKAVAAKRAAAAPRATAVTSTPSAAKPELEKSTSARKSPRAIKSAQAGGNRRR
jgi:hypothetical protein